MAGVFPSAAVDAALLATTAVTSTPTAAASQTVSVTAATSTRVTAPTPVTATPALATTPQPLSEDEKTKFFVAIERFDSGTVISMLAENQSLHTPEILRKGLKDLDTASQNKLVPGMITQGRFAAIEEALENLLETKFPHVYRTYLEDKHNLITDANRCCSVQ